MTVLSAQDEAIVRASLRGVRPEQIPELRAIHEKALAEAKPKAEALLRAIAMRTLSLSLLDEVGDDDGA